MTVGTTQEELATCWDAALRAGLQPRYRSRFMGYVEIIVLPEFWLTREVDDCFQDGDFVQYHVRRRVVRPQQVDAYVGPMP